MYHDSFDDDDYPFTAATQSNDDYDCLMVDSQSNADNDDSPFRDSFDDDDDDDAPLMDDSQSNINQVNHSQTRQPHPSTLSGRIELSDSPMTSQMPPFELPMSSGVSPDAIAQLTPAELSHNPEFMQLYNRFQTLQTTLSAYEVRRLCQQRIQAEIRARAKNQIEERVLEWRLRVHA